MQLKCVLLLLVVFANSLYANNLNTIIKVIQTQDIVQMTNAFDTLEPMTLGEARTFLDELYHQFHQTSGLKKKK